MGGRDGGIEALLECRVLAVFFGLFSVRDIRNGIYLLVFENLIPIEFGSMDPAIAH